MVDIISHIFILNKGYSTTNMRELGAPPALFWGERRKGLIPVVSWCINKPVNYSNYSYSISLINQSFWSYRPT